MIRNRLRRPFPVAVAACLLVLTGGPSPARAEDDGMFVSVNTPITSTVVNGIKNQIDARRNNSARRVTKVVFDFNPADKPAASIDFGACYDLANYIHKLQEIQTIAFVHAKTTGHTVLPVLACKELVMSRENDTALGQILGENDAALSGPEKAAYEVFFGRAPQFAVVQKMFDKGVELVKGVNNRQNRAIWYVDRRNDAAVKDLVNVQDVKFAAPGAFGLYTADQAKELDLRKAAASNRTEVATLYGIPTIDDDILNGRQPDAYRYVLKGDVDGAMRETLGRVVRGIRQKKGNVLLLQLECGGTDLQAARDIADDLRKVWSEGEERILVVAFIPDAANDAATFVAFGCTDIVMSRRKNATERDDGEPKESTIGDFTASIAAGRDRPGFIESHRQSLRELAEKRGKDGVLIDGLFDPTIEIVRVRGAVNRLQTKLMTQAEWDRSNKADWVPDGTVKPKGQLLKLTATRAAELGVARFVVDNRDVKDAASVYGVDVEKIKEATPGWLDRFAEFLRLPVVTVLLVVIGFTGLILEAKVPGLTVPGIVAALCFILVFWAQSRFSGETFVLAMLLFLLGLILLGLEIFVLPGFGAPGVVGILCMLSGLALVTFDKIPQSGAEWTGLGVRVSTYLFAMIGSFVLAFLIAKFLPKVPYANRMILRAPAEVPGAGEPLLPGASAAAELLGAIGTTNTRLNPSGVVRFGDDFVDVVSDGGFVSAGTRVQVIAVEGTRIVVKEV